MINAVGRDIPEEILKATGKEVFQGVHHFDGHVYQKTRTGSRMCDQFQRKQDGRQYP